MALLHLIFEGSRWQMMPFYFLALIFALLALKQFRQRVSSSSDGDGEIRDQKTLWLSGAISALLLLLAASLLPYLSPVFELPTPTGAFSVGMKFLQLIDTDRTEFFTADPIDKREIVVQVWYPRASGAASEGRFTNMHIITSK